MRCVIVLLAVVSVAAAAEFAARAAQIEEAMKNYDMSDTQLTFKMKVAIPDVIEGVDYYTLNDFNERAAAIGKKLMTEKKKELNDKIKDLVKTNIRKRRAIPENLDDYELALHVTEIIEH